MKRLFSLVASSLLLAGTAHAQVTFRFGPQVGLIRSTAYNAQDGVRYSLSARTGVEAGLTGALQVGHFAFQPAVLYSQRGFERRRGALGNATVAISNTRLDYLTVPLQVAYTQHSDGRGFQLFAGPYLGFLLGGRDEWNYGNTQETGRVVVTNTHAVSYSGSGFTVRYPDYNFYGRRLDLGGQVGLGYRLGAALVQVSYSQGLRRVSSPQQEIINGTTFDIDGPNYRNRSVQASLSYLFGAKS